MKKTMLNFALILGLTPFLVQCVASEQDLRGLDLRTRTLDNRISELERLNETVRGQAAAQARQGGELEGINSRLLQHQGRMDEAEHQRTRLQEQSNESRQAINMRLDNIDIALQEITSQQAERAEQLESRLIELTRKQEELLSLSEDNRRQILEVKEQRAREATERAAAAEAAARAAQRAREEAAQRERDQTASQTRDSAAAGSGPREIIPEQSKQKVEDGRTSAPDAAPESSSATPSASTAASQPAPAAAAARPVAPSAAPADAPSAAPSAAPAAAPATTPAAQQPGSAASPSGPGREHYSQGLQHLQGNNHREAYNAFARYLEVAPRGETAADARYLLGESLYQQQEFELAILEFQKVIADFPGHGKIPAALLRQGMAFEQLREPSTAVIVYQRLISEFPNSEQATRAKELLEKIR